ncbi:hypothetical protein Hanom_Chr11g00999301 [Helianthus anomalus]
MIPEEQLYTWFVEIRQEGKKRSLKFSRAPVTKPKCSLGGTVFGFFFIFMVLTHRKESTFGFKPGMDY